MASASSGLSICGYHGGSLSFGQQSWSLRQWRSWPAPPGAARTGGGRVVISSPCWATQGPADDLQCEHGTPSRHREQHGVRDEPVHRAHHSLAEGAVTADGARRRSCQPGRIAPIWEDVTNARAQGRARRIRQDHHLQRRLLPHPQGPAPPSRPNGGGQVDRVQGYFGARHLLRQVLLVGWEVTRRTPRQMLVEASPTCAGPNFVPRCPSTTISKWRHHRAGPGQVAAASRR